MIGNPRVYNAKIELQRCMESLLLKVIGPLEYIVLVAGELKISRTLQDDTGLRSDLLKNLIMKAQRCISLLTSALPI